MSITVDYRQLEGFARELEQMASQHDIDEFYEACTKELAARLLRKVVRRTPVGDYRGDEYTTKTGKKRHKRVKTVKFTTSKGKNVEFEAHVKRKGGTLRRGWTVSAEEAWNGKKVSVNDFIQDVSVTKIGDTYSIAISNNVEYARYVEYGHRTRDHKGWVNGVFMLTVSEEELKRQMDAIVAKRLREYLRRCFND